MYLFGPKKELVVEIYLQQHSKYVNLNEIDRQICSWFASYAVKQKKFVHVCCIVKAKYYESRTLQYIWYVILYVVN